MFFKELLYVDSVGVSPSLKHRICSLCMSSTCQFAFSLLCILPKMLQKNRASISLLILYYMFLLNVLCNGSEPWLCNQNHGFLTSFLNYYYLYSTKKLILSKTPECQEAYLFKQYGLIAGTCSRRKTNVTHSLKLFRNRPLGFYIFFLVSVKSPMELESFVTPLIAPP